MIFLITCTVSMFNHNPLRHRGGQQWTMGGVTQHSLLLLKAISTTAPNRDCLWCGHGEQQGQRWEQAK
jgi:hypothetical protein